MRFYCTFSFWLQGRFLREAGGEGQLAHHALHGHVGGRRQKVRLQQGQKRTIQIPNRSRAGEAWRLINKICLRFHSRSSKAGKRAWWECAWASSGSWPCRRSWGTEIRYVSNVQFLLKWRNFMLTNTVFPLFPAALKLLPHPKGCE